MKTNQIMVREEKQFLQRTKDGYFSATTLLNYWNTNNPKKRKEMGIYKRNKSTKEFIKHLQKENIENPYISSNKGTWLHPKLFIDFAMWVSVEFKSKVIDYVLDGLIFNRNEAGDYYKEMCATIMDTHIEFFGTKPNPKIYSEEANRITKILKLHKKDRNLMTENELNTITVLQKTNVLLLRKKVGKDARIKQLMLQAEILNIDDHSL